MKATPFLLTKHNAEQAREEPLLARRLTDAELDLVSGGDHTTTWTFHPDGTVSDIGDTFDDV